jgi:hypothetical protein
MGETAAARRLYPKGSIVIFFYFHEMVVIYGRPSGRPDLATTSIANYKSKPLADSRFICEAMRARHLKLGFSGKLNC